MNECPNFEIKNRVNSNNTDTIQYLSSRNFILLIHSVIIQNRLVL